MRQRSSCSFTTCCICSTTARFPGARWAWRRCTSASAERLRGACTVAILFAMQTWGEQGGARPELRRFCGAAGNVLALIGLTYEVRDVFGRALAEPGRTDFHNLRIARDFSYSALYMIYGGALMAIG